MVFTILLVALLVCNAQSMLIRKCGDTNAPLPKRAIIGNCDTVHSHTPCMLKVGEPFDCKIHFRAPQDAEKVKRIVTLKHNGLTNKIIDEPNACDHMKRCPLRKGVDAYFRETDSVPKNIKKGVKTVDIRFTDMKSGKALMCFQFEATYV